jgi:pimeloyl-ACP methyl ester carboxylesterase
VITVPTLVLFGAEDPHRILLDGQEHRFEAEHRVELVPGARHFIHREQPDRVNRLLQEWIGT